MTDTSYPFNQTPLATVLMALADAIAKRRQDLEYWQTVEDGKYNDSSITKVIEDEIGVYERFMNDLNGRVFVITTPVGDVPTLDSITEGVNYSGNPLDPADGRAPSNRD